LSEDQQPTEAYSEEASCPICRVLLPKSTRGKAIVLVVLLAMLAAVVWVTVFDEDPEELIHDGIRLYNEGKLDEAKAALDKALRLDANKPLALDYLGLIALKQGDVDGAIACRKRAIEIDPHTPQHYYNAAQLYLFGKKDPEAAETMIAPALKLGPKMQCYLLYAICAVELEHPQKVVAARLRAAVDAGATQVYSLRVDQLQPDGVFAGWWQETSKRLDGCGDSYGYDKLVALADQSPKEHVRTFAKDLLDAIEKAKKTPTN